MTIIQEVENRDISARAKLAAERRSSSSFQEKPERERNRARRVGSDRPAGDESADAGGGHEPAQHVGPAGPGERGVE